MKWYRDGLSSEVKFFNAELHIKRNFLRVMLFLLEINKGSYDPLLQTSDYNYLTYQSNFIFEFVSYLKRIERSIAFKCLVSAPTEM